MKKNGKKQNTVPYNVMLLRKDSPERLSLISKLSLSNILKECHTKQYIFAQKGGSVTYNIYIRIVGGKQLSSNVIAHSILSLWLCPCLL